MTKTEINKLKSEVRKSGGLGNNKGTENDLFIDRVFEMLYNTNTKVPYPESFKYTSECVSFEWDASDSHLILSFYKDGRMQYNEICTIQELYSGDFEPDGKKNDLLFSSYTEE